MTVAAGIDLSPTTPEAVRMLDDAVTALLGPRTRRIVTDEGRVVIATAPSIYTEMQESTAGQTGTGLGSAHRSLPPVWLGCVDWLRKLDHTVQEWVGMRTVPDALAEVLRWSWTPEQVPIVLLWAQTIREAVQEAEQLLDSRHDFPLSAPCPICEAVKVEAVDDCGDAVHRPAVRVSMAGAKCQGCGHRWGPDELLTLAAAVGAGPLGEMAIPATTMVSEDAEAVRPRARQWSHLPVCERTPRIASRHLGGASAPH